MYPNYFLSYSSINISHACMNLKERASTAARATWESSRTLITSAIASERFVIISLFLVSLNIPPQAGLNNSKGHSNSQPERRGQWVKDNIPTRISNDFNPRGEGPPSARCSFPLSTSTPLSTPPNNLKQLIPRDYYTWMLILMFQWCSSSSMAVYLIQKRTVNC